MEERMQKAVWSLALVVMVGCAHTNIIPYANGDFLMVASSASEAVAYDQALEQSQEYCGRLGRRFGLIGQRTQYQGMDKTARGVIAAVDMLTFNRHGRMYGMTPTASSNDYKVELTFRCL
jgi:hypothetical protein